MEAGKENNCQETFGDFDLKNLLCDQEETEVPLLTEMVRNHYLNYLEKQLMENFLKCYNNLDDNTSDQENEQLNVCSEKYKTSIKKTAFLLEDKAVEACRIALRYQRAMVKIIAIVRRSTQEKRLITPLENTILNFELNQPQTKGTQTDAVIDHKTNVIDIPHRNETISLQKPEREIHSNEDTSHEMTLDEKIEIFKRHLQNGHNTHAVDITRHADKSLATKRHCQVKKSHKSNREHHHHPRRHHNHHRPYKEINNHQMGGKLPISPADTMLTSQKSSPHPVENPLEVVHEEQEEEVLTKSINNLVADMENSNDSVALELARLFSEEKTELDEIFGIDPNQEPDDPQICKILKEIEQAQVGGGCGVGSQQQPQEHTPKYDNIQKSPTIQSNSNNKNNADQTSPNRSTNNPCEKDLSNSLWPCELFMQKRKLSESLARLLEEDLRWHDIMKWKFAELFGEDSDDEFTPCSPSIELDEILMGSCVKRISPWVVKHLMKPMKHGLIGNRFVFKKLAKHIARSIIMENQYPDEAIVKGCIENYFCLHQAVMTLDDLQDVPSISLI
ncbi:uncharacterized protein LOC101895974 [Musca domestica]|uniref:Uncharacterized protein LOC101895974 n=1 Tax=Musca domestica TaxID=7370 RepID=A0A9J7D2A9_MUSDO|nr:uncharacterized protein LOC101895974 [Musca domestica]